MKAKAVVVTAIAFLIAAANIASAELIQGISIDFVTIGNPGNPGDTRAEANPTGCGAVDYIYQIGKYEVTNAQWYDFVSAAGAPTGNDSGAYDEPAYWTGDDIPTNEVCWYEVLQFCNYLTSGDKSQGAYKFSGDNSNPGDFEGIDRNSAVSTYGIVYVIPTEDEWYKAAYYTGSGYSIYANGTDTAPLAGVDTNYARPVVQPWNVGSGTEEHNGTFDMMGNIFEWNETRTGGSLRGSRGGSYHSYSADSLGSSSRGETPLTLELSFIGFRVASIPEPATLLLLAFGGSVLGHKRRS